MNIAPPLSELSAVCDELNESIILTADTVQRLSPLRSYESILMTDSDTTCDNVEPVRHEEPVMEKHYEIDSQSANTATLINEQKANPALAKYFDMIRQGHKQYFIRDSLLYHAGRLMITRSNNSVYRRDELKLY